MIEDESVKKPDHTQEVFDNDHKVELELQKLDEILRETDLEHELKKYQLQNEEDGYSKMVEESSNINCSPESNKIHPSKSPEHVSGGGKLAQGSTPSNHHSKMMKNNHIFQYHNLDLLVFEKRERKKASNLPAEGKNPATSNPNKSKAPKENKDKKRKAEGTKTPIRTHEAGKKEEKGKKTAVFKELTKPISEPLQIYTNITNKESLPKTEKGTPQPLKSLPTMESHIPPKGQPSSTSSNNSNEITKELPKTDTIDVQSKSNETNEPLKNVDESPEKAKDEEEVEEHNQEQEQDKTDDQISEESQEESNKIAGTPTIPATRKVQINVRERSPETRHAIGTSSYRKQKNNKKKQGRKKIQKGEKESRKQTKQLNKIFKREELSPAQYRASGEGSFNPQKLFKNHYEVHYTSTLDTSSKKVDPSLKKKKIKLESDVERSVLETDIKTEKEPEEEEQAVEGEAAIIKKKRYIKKDLLDEESRRNMQELQLEIFEAGNEFYPIKTFISCDLRYFNLDYLIERIGNFDVILMDPPWRIKGGQQNDSQFMFSNSKFSLDYNTMSNQEIMNLRVDRLSKKGFIFLWILNTQLNIAYEMLNKWGYEVVDQLIWVKMKDEKIYMTHGYYFMHSFEICLVGYKCPPGEHVEYHSKVSNNLIFANVQKKSQKPNELYDIIDLLMPGAKKIELFARNHNLRPGWFSLGNQLGTLFDQWYNQVECNSCLDSITLGKKRYKSRKDGLPNYDICEKCYKRLECKPEDFFEMKNQVDEEVIHYYHKCNNCHVEPIWGTRFTCDTCDNYDLCEACFDLNLAPETRFHEVDHPISVLEIPLLANGLPAHAEVKCNSCFQKPIIGVCFNCSQCNNFNLCQNCFFSKTFTSIRNLRGHKANHKMDIIIEPQSAQPMKKKPQKCSWCAIDPIEGEKYKCTNCWNFYFCEKCYLKREEFKTNMATNHKIYHDFIKV